MQCPYCGGEMRHGEITTAVNNFHNHLMWMEGNLPDKKRKFFGMFRPGKLLQMPYVGTRFWLPADFCPKCKKMIFDTDIIES